MAEADPAIVERVKAARDVSFEHFPRPLDLNEGLPKSLTDVLSRVVALRTGTMINGPLASLVAYLSVNHIRVLDLQGCRLEGRGERGGAWGYWRS